MKRNHYIIFAILIAALSIYFDYHTRIFDLPNNHHNWRQADCASFALNYYQNGMSFFHPQVHNCLNVDGYAVGECPLIYYFVAALYHIFGPHEVIFKGVNLLIFYCGLFALFNLTYRLTRDIFSSYITPLLFFITPLTMYFANTYLTDVSSISMCFVGWNYFLKYRDESKKNHFLLSMVFFLIASLLKANALISFLALGGIFFIELNNWGQFGNNNEKLFKHTKYNIIGFVLVLIIAASWYRWAIYYNELHGTSFLGTRSWPGWPIWEASEKDFISTFNTFFLYSNWIYNLLSIVLFLFLFIFVFVNRIHLPAFFLGVIIITTIGIFSFINYFFVGFRDQSYYFVNLLILPVFVFIGALIILQKKYSVVFQSIVFRVGVVAFIIFTSMDTKASYSQFLTSDPEHKVCSEPGFRSFIDSIIPDKKSKIISIFDVTPNITLYYYNRPGWSNYNHGEYDIPQVERMIPRGAKYLIISDTAHFFSDTKSNWRQFFGKCIGSKQNICIYKLPDIKGLVLKAYNNKYVCADMGDGGILRANRNWAGEWETFIMSTKDDGRISLKAAENQFISANLDNMNTGLVANRTEAQEWELFKIVKLNGNKVALQASNGKYARLDTLNQNRLFVISDKIGPLETFDTSK